MSGKQVEVHKVSGGMLLDEDITRIPNTAFKDLCNFEYDDKGALIKSHGHFSKGVVVSGDVVSINRATKNLVDIDGYLVRATKLSYLNKLDQGATLVDHGEVACDPVMAPSDDFFVLQREADQNKLVRWSNAHGPGSIISAGVSPPTTAQLGYDHSHAPCNIAGPHNDVFITSINNHGTVDDQTPNTELQLVNKVIPDSFIEPDLSEILIRMSWDHPTLKMVSFIKGLIIPINSVDFFKVSGDVTYEGDNIVSAPTFSEYVGHPVLIDVYATDGTGHQTDYLMDADLTCRVFCDFNTQDTTMMIFNFPASIALPKNEGDILTFRLHMPVGHNLPSPSSQRNGSGSVKLRTAEVFFTRTSDSHIQTEYISRMGVREYLVNTEIQMRLIVDTERLPLGNYKYGFCVKDSRGVMSAIGGPREFTTTGPMRLWLKYLAADLSAAGFKSLVVGRTHKDGIDYYQVAEFKIPDLVALKDQGHDTMPGTIYSLGDDRARPRMMGRPASDVYGGIPPTLVYNIPGRGDVLRNFDTFFTSNPPYHYAIAHKYYASEAWCTPAPTSYDGVVGKQGYGPSPPEYVVPCSVEMVTPGDILDTTPDLNLGVLLQLTSYAPASLNLDFKPEILVSFRQRAFGVVRSTDINGFYREYLRWSDVLDFETWDPLNELYIEPIITGARVLRDDLMLVWSPSKTYLVTPDGTGFSAVKIDDVGMPFHHLSTSTNNRIYWYNSKGMWQYDGAAVTIVPKSIYQLSIIGSMLTASARCTNVTRSSKVFLSLGRDSLVFDYRYGVYSRRRFSVPVNVISECEGRDDTPLYMGTTGGILEVAQDYQENGVIVPSHLISKGFASNDSSKMRLYYVGIRRRVLNTVVGALLTLTAFTEHRTLTKTLSLLTWIGEYFLSEKGVYLSGDYVGFRLDHAVNDGIEITEIVVGAQPHSNKFDTVKVDA